MADADLMTLCEPCAVKLKATGYDSPNFTIAVYPAAMDRVCESCRKTRWTLRCLVKHDPDKWAEPKRHETPPTGTPAYGFGPWGSSQ